MKRIIAAALSVLVGAFGYTIVDQAMEDRVTNLESEVVELREEVSRYHPKYETSFDDITTTTEEDIITTERTTETTATEIITTETTATTASKELQVGDYLIVSSNSRSKFLIREYNYGRKEYIAYNNYTPLPTTTKNPTTTTKISNPYDDFGETTTSAYVIGEYFLYLTDVTAQWTDTTEEVSYATSYDKDYSQVTKKYTTEKNYITVKYKGYTDPNLANTKINFIVDDYMWNQISISRNVIDENGYFDFEVVYCSQGTPSYICVNSIKCS